MNENGIIKTVDKKPSEPWGESPTLHEAERILAWNEIYHEVSCEIVEFEGWFYILPKLD